MTSWFGRTSRNHFCVNYNKKIDYEDLRYKYEESLQFMRTYIAGFIKGGTPATSRHTSHTLRLLPSGPDRVHELLLREDQGPIILF